MSDAAELDRYWLDVYGKSFDKDQPRGQPDNAGQFASVNSDKPHFLGNAGNAHAVLVIPDGSGGERRVLQSDPDYLAEVGKVTVAAASEFAESGLADAVGDDEPADQIQEVYDNLEAIIGRWEERIGGYFESFYADHPDLVDDTKIGELFNEANRAVSDALWGGDDIADEDAAAEAAEAIKTAFSELDTALVQYDADVYSAVRERDETWQTEASGEFARLNGESTEEDIAAANVDLAESGNPYRIYWDDDTERWGIADESDAGDYPGKPEKGKRLTGIRRKQSFNESDHPRGQPGNAGQFGSGVAQPAPKRSWSNRIADGVRRAGEVAGSAVKVPAKALKKAKALGKAAMGKIERRYGKGVKKAVGAAVLLSLPLPVPGMSVILSAPILAFAELYKQFSGKEDGGDIDDAEVKRLATYILGRLFKGEPPAEAVEALAGMFDDESNGDGEPEGKTFGGFYFDGISTMTTKHAKRVYVKDDAGGPLHRDAAKLYMRFLVSTPAVDRDWEIVVPTGRQGAAYDKANGPWFFNHQQCPFVIGSSRPRNPDGKVDPDAPLDIEVTPEGILQGLYFNQHTDEAVKLYRLYDDGDMKATSIGFRTMSQERIDGEESRKLGSPYGVVVHTQWEHVETSLVGIGCNREALTVRYEKGFFPDSMRPYFARYLLPKKFFRAGAETLDGRKLHSPVSKALGTQDDTAGGSAVAEANDSKPIPHEALEKLYAAHKGLMDEQAGLVGKMEADGEHYPAHVKALKACHKAVSDLHESRGGNYEGLELPELHDTLVKAFDSLVDTDPADDKPAKNRTADGENDEDEKALAEMIEKALADAAADQARIAELEKQLAAAA